MIHRWNPPSSTALLAGPLLAFGVVLLLSTPALAQFKEGVDAGYRDLRGHEDQLKRQQEELERILSSGAEEQLEKLKVFDRQAVKRTAGDIGAIFTRMKSAFERIGNRLHDEQRGWGEKQRGKLVEICSAPIQAASELAACAEENHAYPRMQAVKLVEKIDRLRRLFPRVHETVTEVAQEFERQKEANQRASEERDRELRVIQEEMKRLADDVRRDREEADKLYEVYQAAVRAQHEQGYRVFEQSRRRGECAAKLEEAEKRDPPLSESDLGAFQLELGRAITEERRANDEYKKLVDLASRAYSPYGAKAEARDAPMKRYQELYERRDKIGDEMRKAHHIMVQFKQEYPERPSF